MESFALERLKKPQIIIDRAGKKEKAGISACLFVVLFVNQSSDRPSGWPGLPPARTDPCPCRPLPGQLGWWERMASYRAKA